MNISGTKGTCQLQYINEIGQKNSWLEDKLLYPRRMLKVILEIGQKNSWFKDKLLYIRRIILRRLDKIQSAVSVKQLNQEQIQAGDMVKVRSKAEIERTLGWQRQTRGCIFQTKMYDYCGKKYRVFKKVDRFFDETKQKTCKCTGIFLLEGAYCDGKRICYQTCSRNCFYFWQASWLEKI